MYKKLFERLRALYEVDLDHLWIFIITFILVFFLSRSLYVGILGDGRSLLSIAFLTIWSLSVSFYLIFGNVRALSRIVRGFGRLFTHAWRLILAGEYDGVNHQTDIRRVPEVNRLESAPVDLFKENPGNELEREAILEKTAHREGVLISEDALTRIASYGDEAEAVLRSLIEKAKIAYPRFDGWIILNNERITTLLEESAPRVQTEASRNIEPPANLPVGKLHYEGSAEAATFCELLCDGDEKGLFSFMRSMRQGSKGDMHRFITETVLMLDRVHAHRMHGEGYVPENILEHTNCFSTEELEEIIAILTSSIDYRYTTPELGAKMALVRALDYIKKHRNRSIQLN